MFDEQEFRRHAETTLQMLDRMQQFRRLFKTEGGHLTIAGQAVVREGIRQQMNTAEIAALLDVNQAVVRYHARRLARRAGELELLVS